MDIYYFISIQYMETKDVIFSHGFKPIASGPGSLGLGKNVIIV